MLGLASAAPEGAAAGPRLAYVLADRLINTTTTAALVKNPPEVPPIDDVTGVAHEDAAHLPIVVHSHLRWDFVWQRPQQILARLAASHPVAFIEEPVPHDETRLDI